MDTTKRLLRKVSIFADVDEEAVEALARAMRQETYTKDEIIVDRNEKGDALFVIRKGRVKVVLQGGSGREMILSTFREGDFFGEMSLLDGQPRSASVVATEDAELLVLSREDFLAHLEKNPRTAINILAEMSRRLRRADTMIGNLALLDVFGRLARVLMELADRDGRAVDEGVLIRNRPTQQELAAMIGTSRETVSRALSELQRRGFVSLQGRHLLLSHSFAERDALPFD